MLVVTRARGETILIGDDVVVRINAVSGKRVRLGIMAPRHVPVFRGELGRSAAAVGGCAAKRRVG